MDAPAPLKTYTVCAAFYDSDCRATATVEARSSDEACAKVVALIDDGEIGTQPHRYDPGPTFVYGVAEGDGDPFASALPVPSALVQPTMIHDGDAVSLLVQAARALVAAGHPSPLAPVQSRALDQLVLRLAAFADVPA